MGQAIRRETVLKGFDPRQFILFAFGAPAPPRCGRSLRRDGQDRGVPVRATFCAFGSSTMDVVHVYERSRHLHVLHLSTGAYLDDYATFNETVRRLREVAQQRFGGEGYDLTRSSTSSSLT